MNSKITAIIAEDEPPMGRFIKNAIEQEGVYVCSVCETSDEAIAKLYQYNADLLITDICMPGMSGLELIKRAQSINPNLQFIIISGYKNFEYAKEAVSLGVEEYLTKPIELNELKKTIKKICANADYLRLEKKMLLYQEAFSRQDNYQLNQMFPFARFSVLAIFCVDSDHNRFKSSVKGTTDYFRYKNTSFILFEKNAQTGYQQMADIIESIEKDLGSETYTRLYIETVEKEEDLYKVLHAIRNKVQMLTFPGEKNHYSFKNIDEIVAETITDDNELLRKISAAFSVKSIDRITNLLEQLFMEWKRSRASVFYMKSRLRKIVDLTEQYYFTPQTSYNFSEIMTDLLSHINSYEGFCKELTECIVKINADEKKGRGSNSTSEYKIFQKIIHIIEDEQNKNFSLLEISQIFNFSQPYIRSLFKKYTGKNFKTYVLDSKISYAKHLIRENPNVLIKDVAASIGFDQLYFTTVFNKYVGMSPSQYKLNQSDKGERKE